MIFNSSVFIAFFLLFFLFYWFIFNKNIKYQNLFLLFGNYTFYGWADFRFLLFLIVVSLLNYFLGIYIEKENKYKRLYLSIGLLQGIGSLVFFKYYNFFISSFNDAFHSINVNINLQTLNIIIPLGISFFTFRTISYILDIDRGKISATKKWVVFFNYVSFFPTIISGPIDKANSFVPQLEKKRKFDQSLALDGMNQIMWGFFKKMVIADNCASITNQIFDNYQTMSGSTLLIGAFSFTIQIYADFSGYSDMAIGFSRLLGFNISKNFDFPFFSQNIAEFWRKWHISLTSWLLEYVFTPLSIAFRDYDKMGLIFAILINFTIVGFWHGANWTYALFGILHGCFFIPLILKGTMNKKKIIAKGRLIPSLKELINVVITFTLVMLSLILFRSVNFEHAYQFYGRLFSSSFFSLPIIPGETLLFFTILLIFIVLMFTIEWIQREKEHALVMAKNPKNRTLIVAVYYIIIFSIILFGSTDKNEFIYFKF